MIDEDLTQIEADVVITLELSNFPYQGRVIPFWECEHNLEALHRIAQKCALQFIEELEGSGVSYKIHDFR